MVQFLMNFFSSYIVFILLFIVLLKISCYQIQKTEICCKFFFDRKRTCTACTFVMCKSNCEDFEHWHLFVLWMQVVFFKISSWPSMWLCMHNCCEESLKKHEHVVALKSRNVYIHMFHYQVYALWMWCWYTLSKPCIELIYMAQSALPL